MTSFMVKARVEDVVLLPPGDRFMLLERGKGWSGQTSWWYADDTRNPDARRFVEAVRLSMAGDPTSQTDGASGRGKAGGEGRAGAAASDAYQRYVAEYEVRIHPRHNKLQQRFERFLGDRYPVIEFPQCYRDDLRYSLPGQDAVMVEVKPTDSRTLRFAIRTAIGQLLDYKQHQQWLGRQLILVETEVSNADDLRLAHDSGFGLAWPDKAGSFYICWPDKAEN